VSCEDGVARGPRYGGWPFSTGRFGGSVLRAVLTVARVALSGRVNWHSVSDDVTSSAEDRTIVLAGWWCRDGGVGSRRSARSMQQIRRERHEP
jgi:hypothetical protein